MPKQFPEKFDASRGDLIYGITPARTAYNKLLEAAGVAQGDEWTYIDYFNNFFGLSDVDVFKYEKTGQVPDKLRQLATSDEYELPIKKRALTYGFKISDSRYGPKGVMELSPLQVLSEGYVAANASNQDLVKKASAKNHAYKAIRRGCKFGIGMTAGERACVHFVLDGLGALGDIAKKTALQLEVDRNPFLPITSSELRYVFRNWSKLSETVLFYMDGNVVEPPWLSDWTHAGNLDGCKGPVTSGRAEWLRYEQRRQVKHGGRIPDKTLV